MDATGIKYTALRTLGELKAAIKTADALYVWVAWEDGADGDYIMVPKKSFLRCIGADTPQEIDENGEPTGHGGRGDYTACKAEMRGNEVYVN